MKTTLSVDRTTLDISLNPDVTYGILMSGGLDSSVLMALLIEESLASGQDPEKIFVFTIPKLENSVSVTNSVLAFLEEKYNVKLRRTVTVGDPTVAHNRVSATAVIEAFTNYPIGLMYMGTTQNPPKGEINQGMEPVRVTHSPSERVILPFIKLDKAQTVNMLVQKNLSELLDITYSCTEQANEPCQVCWQCGERAWALNEFQNRQP